MHTLLAAVKPKAELLAKPRTRPLPKVFFTSILFKTKQGIYKTCIETIKFLLFVFCLVLALRNVNPKPIASVLGAKNLENLL